ncbi:MAG TPA: serine hydrolase domain-containing protein [Gemmataceae bacterium]|nr:serine hydrolase domain-containing protein [Gemmataceae bacterium]
MTQRNRKGTFLIIAFALAATSCLIWAVLYGRNGYVVRNIPDDALKPLADLAKEGADLKSLSFSARPPILCALSKDDREMQDQILKRMAHFKVPGLSIAVVTNYRLEWARGYGVARASSGRAVTETTSFQAASISKTVTTVAALRLVQQGRLNLDQALNEKLVTWKVGDNEFTRREKPTLRQLLSHSAGFSVGGFDGYEVGDRLPTLLQILNGKPPANSRPIQIESVPGSKYQYSGGGFTVLQQLIIDVTRTPFPEAMQDLVLVPAGMKDSTFRQPPPVGFDSRAAGAHFNRAALRGDWHVYPELAAAGMWTTPSDLARFIIALQKAKRGDKDAILSPHLIDEMFRRQIAEHGLGVALRGEGRSALFFYYGINAGFDSCFMGTAQTGQGAVLMTNASGGKELIDELLECIRKEYGW